MNFKSEKELQPIYALCNEADYGIIDKARTINNSSLKETLLKVVKCNMLIGSLLLPTPIGLIASIGFIIKHNKKLQNEKLMCYRTAIAKQNAIIEALQKETQADKERIEYLTALNTALTEAVQKLQSDLS